MKIVIYVSFQRYSFRRFEMPEMDFDERKRDAKILRRVDMFDSCVGFGGNIVIEASDGDVEKIWGEVEDVGSKYYSVLKREGVPVPTRAPPWTRSSL